ncbi:MAG: GH3 auxin-responsive promoter family protein [Bacteroidota bacterium]
MQILVHKAASWIIKRRMNQIEQFMQFPDDTQYAHLMKLLGRARNTEWGKRYHFSEINRIDSFRERG